MDSSLICYILADPDRQAILRYVNHNGRTPQTELALAVNGRGVDDDILETHIPLLVDYGILERDGDWVSPTSDSFLVTDCLDSIEASVPERPRSTPVESA